MNDVQESKKTIEIINSNGVTQVHMKILKNSNVTKLILNYVFIVKLEGLRRNWNIVTSHGQTSG
jgi:hypothetical protein